MSKAVIKMLFATFVLLFLCAGAVIHKLTLKFLAIDCPIVAK